jgi:TetR/AcrR family transcriptional regulator
MNHMPNPDLLSPPRVAKPVRRRGRPAGDDAAAVPEERVLDLAFHAFSERGYEGTTLRELAKQLGVSHNLINVRFGSKADLWRRAVDARVARIAPRVWAAFDAPGLEDSERLAMLIHSFCRWASENLEFVGLSHIEGRRATWRLDYLVNAYIQPFKTRFDALLNRVGSQRQLRDISSSALMALLVEGVGFYFSSAPLLARMGAADEIAPERIAGQAEKFAEFLIAGLLI